MCIIVYKPKGVSVDLQILETCFHHNPDGAGFMIPCEGNVLIKKGYFEFDGFRSAWEKHHAFHGDSLPVVFHFRIATAGQIDTRNCHPHRIAPDLAFVHNGILSNIKVPKGGKLSDTILYRNRYFGRMKGKTLHNHKLFTAIGGHIGAGNKFVFMNGNGKVVICNDEQGVWKDGIWYSNSSFQPRYILPLPFRNGSWVCDYCGQYLDTPEELDEGVCQSCMGYLGSGNFECNGCYSALTSFSHRELGWCDDCGHEIYGRDWTTMIRKPTTASAAIESLWL